MSGVFICQMNLLLTTKNETVFKAAKISFLFLISNIIGNKF